VFQRLKEGSGREMINFFERTWGLLCLLSRLVCFFLPRGSVLERLEL
jgi:hypothetical protein